jgi:hypothetical protein
MVTGGGIRTPDLVINRAILWFVQVSRTLYVLVVTL